MRYKYDLDILGKNYDITFYDIDKKEWNKIISKIKGDDEDNILGLSQVWDKKIYIFVSKWEDDIDWENIEITLWHEIGHALDRELPNSIVYGEWSSVLMEYAFKYQHKLNDIFKDFKKKVLLSNKKVKKNGK